ncbi:MAG TPA: YkgJ family cysteine cluster protein [Actinobacteria bacterium]|nr:YkgJ family cysteine cluster protein [Actinomycetota bacterium]
MNNGDIVNMVSSVGDEYKNPAARILAATEETDCYEYLGQLKRLYELSDTLEQGSQECRKCGVCCNQTTRHLEVFAIEIAYMFEGTDVDRIPVIDWESSVCPSRTKIKKCRNYTSRPLGCRLFIPWTEWSEEGGCGSFPHDKETFNKINYLLDAAKQLNESFIRKTGLFRNFEFDFLSHWSVLQWFFSLEVA